MRCFNFCVIPFSVEKTLTSQEKLLIKISLLVLFHSLRYNIIKIWREQSINYCLTLLKSCNIRKNEKLSPPNHKIAIRYLNFLPFFYLRRPHAGARLFASPVIAGGIVYISETFIFRRMLIRSYLKFHTAMSIKTVKTLKAWSKKHFTCCGITRTLP